jgi:type I restriction enzyme, S subunit
MERIIPEHWVWSTVGKISSLLRGISYQKHQAEDYESDENCLILRGGNIQNGKILIDNDLVYVPKELVDEKQLLKNGDVIIVGSTGSKDLIGKAALATKDENKISFGAFLILIRPLEAVNKRYFGYFFLSDEYRQTIRESSGGVNINNIRREHITSLNFPLPPSQEQKRIVFKLDTVFAHLDQLKARLENIPTLLKEFRQAVLTQAVTGKLTEEWRGENASMEFVSFINNDIEPNSYEHQFEIDTWQWSTIASVADLVSGYAFKSNEFSNSGFQLIRMGNLFGDRLDLTRNPVYLRKDIKNNLIEKYSIKGGDILLTLTGTKYKRDYGYAVKVEIKDDVLLLNQRILSIRPIINSNFLLYVLRSDIFRDQFFSFETGGVNQGNVSAKGVSSIVIPIPPIEEQKEIVSRVESLFAVADRIEGTYGSLQEKIDHLPQAILSKAFRGELI